MSRVKTFDATGVAPNGKLYAGDLNNIQDHYADLDNLAQNVSLATLKIGETGLQLLRYGAGEARLTGAFRTDGIIRGLGGFVAGQFTTAQRNAIPSGSRPFGLCIYNTDLNRIQMNIGSDATPNWQTNILGADLVELPVGGMIDYAGSGDVSTSLILADGRELVRADYPVLFGEIGILHGAGNGTTTFNIPDERGRVTVGPDDMGTARGAANRIPNSNRTLGLSGGEERHTTVLAEMAAHNHGGATGGGTTGQDSPDHSHSGSTSTAPNHYHASADNGQYVMTGTGSTAPLGSGGTSRYLSSSYTAGTGPGGTHSHSFTSGGASARHTHSIPGLTISSQGSGTPHNNMQPYNIVNKLIRVL